MGVLWITGGLMRDIPHREAIPAFLAMNLGPSAQILTIFNHRLALKLACTNIKNIFNAGENPVVEKGLLTMKGSRIRLDQGKPCEVSPSEQHTHRFGFVHLGHCRSKVFGLGNFDVADSQNDIALP